MIGHIKIFCSFDELRLFGGEAKHTFIGHNFAATGYIQSAHVLANMAR